MFDLPPNYIFISQLPATHSVNIAAALCASNERKTVLQDQNTKSSASRHTINVWGQSCPDGLREPSDSELLVKVKCYQVAPGKVHQGKTLNHSNKLSRNKLTCVRNDHTKRYLHSLVLHQLPLIARKAHACCCNKTLCLKIRHSYL